MHSDDDAVKLKEPTQMKSKEEIDNCTVYVEQIPLNSTHDSLRTIFSKYGKVNYISLPRYKKSRQLKHFCFIEFDDASSIAKVVAAFKKFDAVLHCSSTKPENLQSIATFDKDKEEEKEQEEEDVTADGEPPAKKACIESIEHKGTVFIDFLTNKFYLKFFRSTRRRSGKQRARGRDRRQ
jgi:La-related protein 7